MRPVAVVAERLGDGTTGALVSVKPHGRITPDGEDDSDEPSSLSYPSSSSSGAPASSLPCLIVDLTSLYNLRPSRHPPESLPLRVAELRSELVSNLEVSWEDGAAGLFGLGVARHEERGRADAKAERLGEAGESLHVVVDYPPVIHEGGVGYDVGRLWAGVRRRSKFNTVNRVAALIRKVGLGLLVKKDLCEAVHGIAEEEKEHLKWVERRRELERWREEGRPEKVEKLYKIREVRGTQFAFPLVSRHVRMHPLTIANAPPPYIHVAGVRQEVRGGQGEPDEGQGEKEGQADRGPVRPRSGCGGLPVQEVPGRRRCVRRGVGDGRRGAQRRGRGVELRRGQRRGRRQRGRLRLRRR